MLTRLYSPFAARCAQSAVLLLRNAHVFIRASSPLSRSRLLPIYSFFFLVWSAAMALITSVPSRREVDRQINEEENSKRRILEDPVILTLLTHSMSKH
jgi:hypothetical protein